MNTIASVAVIIAAAVAIALSVMRIVRGPTATDRVIALDIFLSSALGLCVVASLLTQQPAFLDVGIGLSLISFIGTVGWARLLGLGADKQQPSSDKQAHTHDA